MMEKSRQRRTDTCGPTLVLACTFTRLVVASGDDKLFEGVQDERKRGDVSFCYASRVWMGNASNMAANKRPQRQ